MARSRWPAMLACGAAAVWLSGCGVLPGSSPTSPPGTTAPTAAATVARAPASPVPSPAASPSPSPPPATAAAAAPAAAAPARAQTVYVGNTDGQGVFVRATPAMADRVRAYADGTALTVIGDDVDAEGQKWKHIKTPDGLEGYVPAMYTVETPP